jgi:hypothetical protein
VRRIRLSRLTAISVVLLVGVTQAVLCGRAGAQALPPGQEAESAVVKKPPFYGLGFEVSVWNSSGLWFGGGAYRNEFGFLLQPNWSIGRTFIGKGPLRTMNLSARFFFNAPVAGFDDSYQTGDAPAWSEQQPCALNVDTTLRQQDLPRCPWGRGARRADYSDLQLTLTNPRIYTVPTLKVHLDPSLVVVLPTSAQSRLQTLVMQFTPQLGVGREFVNNRIAVAYTYGLGLPIFRYATGEIYTGGGGSAALPYDQNVLNFGESNFYSDPGRASLLCFRGERCRNPTLSSQHTIRGTVSFNDDISLTVIYRVSSSYFLNPSGCLEVVDGTGASMQVCPNTTPDYFKDRQPGSYWVDNQLFWAMLSWQVRSWVGLSLSYITASPLWQYARSEPAMGSLSEAEAQNARPLRSYRQGLFSFDANAFTSINLGVDFSIEALAAKFLKK